MPESLEQIVSRIDERTAHIARRQDEMADSVKQVCGVVDDHGERIARVETRLGLFGGLALLASTIAGYLGVKN
jgi:hypothetical protein